MKHTPLTEKLYDYAEKICLREHPSLKALRLGTQDMQLAVMQSSPLQAQFLQFLVRVLNAKKVLELGTYTGYGTLAMALALPDDGEIITCDINANWTSHAHEFWKSANQEHKIKLILKPALETLKKQLQAKQNFDFIYIDADKTNYKAYFKYALKLINLNGIIAIDNIFWDGKVIDPNEKTAQTRAIREINQIIQHTKDIYLSLLTLGDGLFLIKRKESHDE
ncbi:MAG: SAM-dependent methyltransferase [Legionellales bacterium RIFCSPHIGHO2_12_FULL_37_14]|nr:MAG: SAM-dependent methyltransferase [Legionellales bacterium RIFCSPHIGHO2_12_FULL_37_14]